MSENKQPGSSKIIRTSSGSTRLTAGSSKSEKSDSSGAAQSPRPAAGSGKAGQPSEPPTVVAPPAPKAAPKPSRAPQGPSSAGSARAASAPSASEPSGSGPATSVLGAAANTVRASSGGVKMGVKNMVNKGNKKKGPRTVRLTVSAVDPWSVMKMSFLMSVAIGVATVVAFIVLWVVLQATGVMSSMESTLTELAGAESAERIIGIFGFGRVVAAGFIIAVINIVLMTALSTLGAFLYNIGSLIAGGFHLTLTDD